MVKIKITAGVYFHNHKTVRAGDPAIEVDEAVARRLVEDKHAAEYVGAPVEEKSADVERAEAAKSIEDMNAKELRELGKECGLTFKVGMTKGEMVEAIKAAWPIPADDVPTFDAVEAVE